MDTSLLPDFGVPPSIRWSMYAGLYTFGCATATAYLLSDLLGILAEVIGLPTTYAMVILASPALVVGTGAWWAVVERRDAYTYRFGGLFGLVTALLTGLLWTVRFVSIWGFEMMVLPMVSVLVAFVLGVAVVAGVLAGLPVMYVRRRLGSGLTGGSERTGFVRHE